MLAKDYQDKEAHLLPAKHLSAWIANNVYLPLDEAPFDREDATLNPAAGACSACPRRSGYNTSLFLDVAGDQCLDGDCYHAKLTGHIDREVAARPELVRIETDHRNPNERHPQRSHAGSTPRLSHRKSRTKTPSRSLPSAIRT
jgi:ParB family chromosome partitioning protein